MFLASLADPRAVLADWSRPRSPIASGSPKRVGGEALLPSGTVATRFNRAGSLIEHALTSAGTAAQLSLSAALGIPRAVHCGPRLQLRRGAQRWQRREFAVPQPKAPWRKAARLPRRRDRLEPHRQSDDQGLPRDEGAMAAAEESLEHGISKEFDDEGPGEDFFGGSEVQ